MKRALAILPLCFFTCVSDAQLPLLLPSPDASVSTTIGLTEVKINYSRPKARGRHVFGDGVEFVVPYDKIWITGANTGTIVEFSDDVSVEGVSVPKGKYLIFTWPGRTEWTIALNRDIAIGGNKVLYDATKDQARFKVKSETVSEKTETFEIGITDISTDNTAAKITMRWENTVVRFNFIADYDGKMMKAIEASTQLDPNNLIAAAQYYYDHGKDLKIALRWTDEFLAAGKNSQQFWFVHLKAKIQKALGDKAGAMSTANQSLELAKKAKNDYDFIKLNEELIKSMR